MKALILSDLHNEFEPFEPGFEALDCDLVILAGDTDIDIKGIRWAQATFPEHLPVLYIPGNHEYYRQKLPKLRAQMKEAAKDSHVHLLDNDQFILTTTRNGNTESVRFLGTTLWTDFECFGGDTRHLAIYEAAQAMNDFRLIRLGKEQNYRALRPLDTLAFHRTALKFLHIHLSQPFEGKTVIISHHAPTIRFTPSQFKDDLVTAAFCSDLEPLISTYAPDMWIFGHQHLAIDSYINRTRMVCNARGYAPDHITEDFRPSLCLDI